MSLEEKIVVEEKTSVSENTEKGVKSTNMEDIIKKRCKKASENVRILLAEMMGTFMLCMFGIGSVAQLVLGRGKFGSWLSLNFGWALGVMIGVYWSAGVSGGHVNPAVSLGMAVIGRIRFSKLAFYWIGQTIGAFLGSALAYGLYYDMLIEYEGKNRTITTASIWSTYPHQGVSHGTIFGDQFVGTALLVGTILALTDRKNNRPKSHILPFIIGLVVLAIGISFGMNVGYGINPARDLIPRIFTAMAGWKSAPFKYDDSFFWIPIIGQLLGGVVGALVYLITIEIHHPAKKDPLYDTTQNEDETL